MRMEKNAAAITRKRIEAHFTVLMIIADIVRFPTDREIEVRGSCVNGRALKALSYR